jgi:hypothetical protein
LNCGEKICRQFVVSGRDGAKELNPVEEALNEIALAVKHESQWRWPRLLPPIAGGFNAGIELAPWKCDISATITKPSTAPDSASLYNTIDPIDSRP